MAKKEPAPPPSSGKDSPKTRRRQLWVTNSEGHRVPFLRGMITHDLVQRGIEFDDAYAAARALRDLLAEREEVSTAEIRDLLQRHLEQALGLDLGSLSLETELAGPGLRVVYNGQEQPFSRGLLARSIHAAGVDFDRAYRLIGDLEAELRAEGVQSLSSDEIVRRVGALLERLEGKAAAQHYRLVRQIRRLPRPLVIYLGGASGTGKSTLSLELAPLLRIFRVNATDTIRQVMRMVFSPAILPALHASSFEIAGTTDTWNLDDPGERSFDDDYVRRLIATFEEQSTRVSVGVRAVVERAVSENMSILVEGVHLYPPLVPFGDLEGSCYQVPLLMASLDEEAHRARFLQRARSSHRRAERYLERFESIRVVHDFLLQLAEMYETPLLEHSSGDAPVERALRLVTSTLRRSMPSLGAPGWGQEHETAPTLLLIIDGLADGPVRVLGGRTPLRAANTPVMDRLAREGRCGLADPISPGVVPDTAGGTLAFFGQSPLAMKRGAVEALGAGFKLRQGDIALRGNFATVDKKGWIIDRRAGRIREGTQDLAQALDHLRLPGEAGGDVEVLVKAGTEHRIAIVLRGQGLSTAFVGSDPGDGAPIGPPLSPRPLDPHEKGAALAARILALFEKQAHKELAQHRVNKARRKAGLPPANAILTREPGRLHHLLPLEDAGVPLRIACVAGDSTILGVAAWLGATTISSEEMTANLDTKLGAKFKAARKALDRSELVALHVKGADIASHDRRPGEKLRFIERIDAALGELLESYQGELRIAIGADHATLSESGLHSADPVPILIWGTGIEADEVKRFDELSVINGELGRIPLQSLLSQLYQLT